MSPRTNDEGSPSTMQSNTMLSDLELDMQKNLRKLRMKQQMKKKMLAGSTSISSTLFWSNQQTYPSSHGQFHARKQNPNSIISPKDKKNQVRHSSHKISAHGTFHSKPQNIQSFVSESTQYSPPMDFETDESVEWMRRKRSNITIFDCAKIYNENGQPLSHEEFENGTPSPDFLQGSFGSSYGSSFGSFGKIIGKKWKKPIKKSQPDHLRRNIMTLDQVVLEIMIVLLPQVEVASELNRLLIFRKAPTANELDLISFQRNLSSLLSSKYSSLPENQLPEPNTSSIELLDLFFSNEFIESTVFKLAHHNKIAVSKHVTDVLMAIYRSMPEMQGVILDSLQYIAIEMYDHQNAKEDSQLPRSSCGEPFSMELNLSLIESILDYHNTGIQNYSNHVSMFDDLCDHEVEQVDAVVLDSIQKSLLYFTRSWSSMSSLRQHDSKQRNKSETEDAFQSNANISCNPLVKLLISNGQKLTYMSPTHGCWFLHQVVKKWPTKCVSRELLYLKIVPILMLSLVSIPNVQEIVSFAGVIRDSFNYITKCIRSPHILTSKEAIEICGNIHIIHLFLLQDKDRMNKISQALHRNSHDHWNEQIRDMSETHFDSMLDFA